MRAPSAASEPACFDDESAQTLAAVPPEKKINQQEPQG